MVSRYRRIPAIKKESSIQYFESLAQMKKSPHYDLLKLEEVEEDE